MTELPPATLPAYLPPPPAPETTDRGRVFVVQLAGYLVLVALNAAAWAGLAALVPALGWVAFVLLGLLVAPFAALLLVEVGDLVADVLGFALARAAALLRRRRGHGWAFA